MDNSIIIEIYQYLSIEEPETSSLCFNLAKIEYNRTVHTVNKHDEITEENNRGYLINIYCALI